jgi:hypothetical protein
MMNPSKPNPTGLDRYVIYPKSTVLYVQYSILHSRTVDCCPDLTRVTTSYVTVRIPASSERVLRENFLDLRELANAELQSVYKPKGSCGQGSCAVGSGFYWAG